MLNSWLRKYWKASSLQVAIRARNGNTLLQKKRRLHNESKRKLEISFAR